MQLLIVVVLVLLYVVVQLTMHVLVIGYIITYINKV